MGTLVFFTGQNIGSSFLSFFAIIIKQNPALQKSLDITFVKGTNSLDNLSLKDPHDDGTTELFMDQILSNSRMPGKSHEFNILKLTLGQYPNLYKELDVNRIEDIKVKEWFESVGRTWHERWVQTKSDILWNRYRDSARKEGLTKIGWLLKQQVISGSSDRATLIDETRIRPDNEKRKKLKKLMSNMVALATGYDEDVYKDIVQFIPGEKVENMELIKILH